MGDQARRLVLAAVVIASLAGATVAARLTVNVAAEASSPVAAPVALAAGASAVAPGNVSSTAWYCTAGAQPTLVFSSLSASVVYGTVTWVTSALKTTVAVPAHGLVEVRAPAQSQGPQGATVLLDGGRVAVTESVRDKFGWSVAACASVTSANWYFPQGSTVAGATVTLDLYDPSVTPAVVDTDLVTPSGETQPAAYQGVAVPAGGLVTEQLNTHATGDPVLGTVVEAASGSVVAAELAVTTGGRHGFSEQLGAPGLRRSWAFPYTVEPKGGSVSFNVINPEPAASRLVMHAVNGSGIALSPVSITVTGQSVASIVLGKQPGFVPTTPYSIVIDASSPVVVGRAVEATKKSTRPSAGYSLGVAVGADRWLVPGVGSQAHPLSLAVEALGSKPLHVTVSRSVGGSAPNPGGSDSVLVVPGEVVHVDPKFLIADPGPLVVVADGPVAVELDATPAGSAGIVVVPAFFLS